MSRRWSDEMELSTTHLGILNMLHEDGVRVSEIAKHMGIKMPSATEALKRLGGAGLATRAADPDDSRVVLIHITPEGEEARTRGNRERDERIAEVLSSMSHDDLAALERASGAIARLSDKFQDTISEN